MTSDHPPTPPTTNLTTEVRPTVVTTALEPIRDRWYAIVVLGASVVGGLLGGVVAGAIGATAEQSAAIGVAGFVIGFVGLLPVAGRFLITPSIWGLAVMAATAAQFLVALMAMFVIIEAFGLPRRPAVFGVLTATMLVLIAETLCAVLLLALRDARMEREKAVGGSGAGGAVSSESTTTADVSGASGRRGAGVPAGRYA